MRPTAASLVVIIGFASAAHPQRVVPAWRAEATGAAAGRVALVMSGAAQFASSPGCGQSYPELCVFDLDACLWDKEMFEMTAVPTEADVVLGDLNGRGTGVIGVMSGRDRISLHSGALFALQEHADGKYPGMRIALASSANTPFAVQIGRKALTMLEVLPNLSVWELLTRDWDGADVNQIGRQPPLSPDKSRTHFPRLREATRVRYDRMLFFDDCNWGNHCAAVEAACKEPDTGRGVVTMRTPLGLGVTEFLAGIDAYATANKHVLL